MFEPGALGPWGLGALGPWGFGALEPWGLGALGPWGLGANVLFATHFAQVFPMRL